MSSPSIFGVKTEEYPLSRRLYLYTRPQALSKHAQSLLDFSLSDQAQPIVTKVGFIDQTIDRVGYAQQDTLNATLTSKQTATSESQALAKLLAQAERLSTTIRFVENDNDTEQTDEQADTPTLTLDVKAHLDLTRVANMLAASKAKKVYLVGFTSDDNTGTSGRQLSQALADRVHQALKANLPNGTTFSIEAKGYGNIAPVACNITPKDKAKNRRVEIWVK